MMRQSNVFSVARAWYALRADLQQQRRAVLVGAGAAAALILAVNVTSANDALGGEFHAAFFPLVLVAGGLLFTSTLFADLHDKPRAHAYLTLPISTLERWAVRLLLSTVGYAAVALVGYFVVTLLGAGVSQLIWGRSHAVFVPDADAWRTVLSYLVTSSLFLFGAVYFRRWHAIKVILGVAALWLALLLIGAGLAWLLFSASPVVPALSGHFDGRTWDLGIPPRLQEAVELGAKVFFWGIMGPLFWFLTYRRLSRAEV